MRKFEEIKYLLNFNQAKPDSNLYIRFVTQYLSSISGTQFQTQNGVLHLTSPYDGPKLLHNDKIIFMGKMLENDKLQGTITKISPQVFRRFKEYVILLRNEGKQSRRQQAAESSQQVGYF